MFSIISNFFTFPGVRTGECVKSDRNSSINVCEIYGWCPTEIDELPMPGYNFRYVLTPP